MTRRIGSGAPYLGALALLLSASLPASAQAPAGGAGGAPFDLSVASIMRGEGLVGRSPSEVRWSEDSRWVYFRWRSPEAKDTATHVYRLGVQGRAPELLPDAVAERTAPAPTGDWSADRRRRAFERNGDVFVAEVGGRERRITDTPVRERGVHLSSDGRTVYFLSGNNLYAVSTVGGPVRQLTDIRLEDAPKKKEAEGQRRFLEEQQTELFGVIRDRVAEKKHREAVDSARTTVRALYVGKNASVTYAEVSPSGRYLLLGATDRADEKQTLVPNFVTESGYTESLNVRSKVGDVQAGQRLAVVELATAKATWLQPEPKERKFTLMGQGWAPEEDRALLIG
ncbi:MAG: hypothetical protein M3P24_10835, partial [Gemmatimonadota bacterium]|nr:hypothetical protein [Gemmatimonadota bacterium]